MAGGIRSWDQHTGLMEQWCKFLFFGGVWDPEDICWDVSVGHDV